MKIFFALAVLLAAVYLAIPEKLTAQLKQYLPQQKIEQAATSLLSRVDEKIIALKQQLSVQQNERIDLLEDKITQLQLQLEKQRSIHSEPQTSAAQTGIKDNNQDLVLPEQLTAAASQLVSLPINNELPDSKPTHLSRQAQLQEIAERMNHSALIAIIGN